MGESSAPRRPTHDTNTSRREVKRSEYTHTQNTNIQIHHENHWIDCIYHAASYGVSTFWSVSFPREWRIFFCFRLQGAGRTRDIKIPCRGSLFKTRCSGATWKKACTHSTC